MKKKNSSYHQIIQSMSIFGGSQVVGIGISIIRTKLLALIIGTAGLGILSIYQSIIDLCRSTCLLGMDTTGVKEIASASMATDTNTQQRQVATTISIFNRWFRVSALLGSSACLLAAYPLSIWVFEDTAYTLPIALLSICVALSTLATGQSVILQGTRHIAFLAKASIWSSLAALVSSIPLYYWLGLEGILPAFVLSSLSLYMCANYYYRKIPIQAVSVSHKQTLEAGKKSLRLGLFIVLAGSISTVSMFVVRGFITRHIGLDAAGLFQAAWTITHVYLTILLRSMGVDFFPRLCAISNHKQQIKQLVNEQSYIVLLLASPIVVAMLLCAAWLLSILYSSDFVGATSLLQAHILGSFFKVVAWPIAFVLLAKNKGFLFLLSEILFYLVYLLASYLLYPHYGLQAVGISYLLAYFLYLPVVLLLAHRIASFAWSKQVFKMLVANLLLILATVSIIRYGGDYWLVGGGILLLLSMAYSYLGLRKVFRLCDAKQWFGKKK